MIHGHSSKHNLERRRAYHSWKKQVKRRDVAYSLDEFVSWWIKQIATRPFWKKPSCGRIDHDRGYSFDNIELQELSENVKEMLVRRGRPRNYTRKVILLDSKGNDAIIFKSIKSAQQILGLNNVSKVCQGKYKQESGFSFRYYDGGEI